MVKNILITDRFSLESLITLQQQPYLNVHVSSSADLILNSQNGTVDLSNIHGLIIRSRTKITESILKLAKNLQVIVTATSGFDHIDLAATQKWGITVMYTPDANIESAAQLTWSLLMAGSRKLIPAHQQVKQGKWQRDLLMGTELQDKNLGIIGLGRIGQRVAEIAKAFRMNLLAYDPFQEDSAFQYSNCQRVAYEEILKTCDYISFHVPKTKLTTNMLNHSHFEYIRSGIGIVNASRGGIINEQDLIQALEKDIIGFCAMDVFDNEPLDKNSSLLKYSNIITTPHIGATTHEAFAKASDQAGLQIMKFFMDGSTENTLPPKSAWFLESEQGI